MDVVIVGAHGKIALALAALLTERGDAVRGVVRKEAYAAELEAAGISPVVVDLEDEYAENDLAHAFRGADAVVFAAGAGPGSTAERKMTVDYGGAVHSAAAAARAEVDRFVIISSIGTDDPPQDDDIFSVY
ncbi:NAD-dependent epimerase/dehydratase family protein, partial [bacterium]